MNCPVQFTSLRGHLGATARKVPSMPQNLTSPAIVPPTRLAVDALVPRANKAMLTLDAAAR
jgi:hypothetical protein